MLKTSFYVFIVIETTSTCRWSRHPKTHLDVTHSTHPPRISSLSHRSGRNLGTQLKEEDKSTKNACFQRISDIYTVQTM